MNQADAPIYDSLIAERGDIPADTRHTAGQTRQEAAEVLDWSTGMARDEEPAAGTVILGAGPAEPGSEHAV